MSIKNPFQRGNNYSTMQKRGVERFSSQTTAMGFVPTVKNELDRLKKEVLSLEARLQYRYDMGVPAAYVGEKIFKPSTDIVDLDVFQDGSATTPVNVVVPSGEDFSIPIILQGPGVFLARYMTVTLYQRYFDPTVGEQWLQLPYGKTFFNTSDTLGAGQNIQTLKRSLMYNQLFLTSLSNEAFNSKLFGCNFFWNFVDEDSERKLGDDFMPDQELQPQGYQMQGDGNVYEFAAPWLFERANTVSLRLRMINDILQLDPSSAFFPVQGVDDRENGQRDQSVKARVELHGQKFYNSRDLLLREAT